eukprot:gene10425-8374_t
MCQVTARQATMCYLPGHGIRAPKFDIHRCQAGLWPNTGKSKNMGEGDGEGYIINVPLPGGSGDLAMREVFCRVLLPAARRFKPDLILASPSHPATRGVQASPATQAPHPPAQPLKATPTPPECPRPVSNANLTRPPTQVKMPTGKTPLLGCSFSTAPTTG